jgi:hypothetical protein
MGEVGYCSGVAQVKLRLQSKYDAMVAWLGHHHHDHHQSYLLLLLAEEPRIEASAAWLSSHRW